MTMTTAKLTVEIKFEVEGPVLNIEEAMKNFEARAREYARSETSLYRWPGDVKFVRVSQEGKATS